MFPYTGNWNSQGSIFSENVRTAGMNFFDAQDKARRATRWLVFVYLIATILIVLGITAIVSTVFYTSGEVHTLPPASVIITTAVMTTLLITGATLFRSGRLAAGGSRVAVDMGGTLVPPDVQDARRQLLRNVVEEMSIASGVPVPQIFVLEAEHGINAFAAGFTTADAAITVTRGCLDLLNRDQLQGVIAHEFSHILNGDMRLNIRMMGVLFGIMVIGMIGRFILRGSYYGGGLTRRRSKGAPVVLMMGVGLTVLGWIGVFSARLIKAAVSRQREFLADASAIQFTRQSEGLANALKKIGGYSDRSYIQRVDPEEVSHMLFASGSSRLTSWFATHPPLTDRIRAIDPAFRPQDYPVIKKPVGGEIAASESADEFGDGTVPAFAAVQNTDIGEAVTDTVGRPQAQHILLAQQLRRSMSPALYAAAHSPDEAFLLAVALALSSDEKHARLQLNVVAAQLGEKRGERIRNLHAMILASGSAYRLALLAVGFPAIRNRPTAQLEFLVHLVTKLTQLDGRVDLGEYCYCKIIDSLLTLADDPASGSGNRVSKRAAQQSAVSLIRIVADQGNHDAAAREAAFEAGIAVFGQWPDEYRQSTDVSNTLVALDDSLDKLCRMNSPGKQSLLRAVCNTITHDGKLSLAEAELLRAICAVLHCPLPPVFESVLNSSD